MKTSNNNIAELYSRIPDYSQVKHLGNSEFINTLEKLKEDFRQCRASLNEIDSDVEYITSQTNKILNISKGSDPCSKINNVKSINITTNRTIFSNSNYLPATSNATINFSDNSQPKNSYLSIKSCSLHKNPNNTLASCFLKERTSFEDPGTSKYESPYAEDYELCSEGSSTPPDSILSKWSSSPEIYAREKEFEPPSNIEKRLLERRSQNNSAPSIPDIDKKPVHFRAHPVPSHVHKPLYEYLMLKNKRRSMRVREASKQKLLSQVKPFSFVNAPKGKSAGAHGEVCERAEELLNNARPTKKRNNFRGGVKTNRFDHHGFRANPAPPRTRALLAAIKLKEQQEYRELKKKLRAEALMKSASLPPSMAARDRRTKANMTRLDELLCRFNSGSDSLGFMRRHFRESSSDTFTDDDRLTDEEIGMVGRRRPTTSKVAACSRKLKGNFTPYGQLRFPISSASEGIFETTSNDNHASRLRVQAAKAKEVNRMKQEEEELTRQMRIDKKRQELREAHLLAWRRAGSYSSSQDIAMRRQLRMATAILERENYRRDMSSMLNRVRSAPLLLEGERKSEPCKRHQKESGRKSPNKLSSPRYLGQQYYNSKSHWSLGKDETEKSETAAMAEGSLTNSDNESVKNPDLEMDDQEEDHPDEEELPQSRSPPDPQNQQYDDNNDFEEDIDDD
ncbi:unnamed protein product [Allacma fusca]|uniref:Protein FAM161A n=1 Tax=Allacma fusca TaxID=39272 RepID=A0A8J2JY58_9HEXA|nr:unnamed protein product [Allacma fusca]